jgi:hypothetical protein
MTWVVWGGTGRFAGAAVSGTTHGSSLRSTGITTASCRGEIAYRRASLIDDAQMACQSCAPDALRARNDRRRVDAGLRAAGG